MRHQIEYWLKCNIVDQHTITIIDVNSEEQLYVVPAEKIRDNYVKVEIYEEKEYYDVVVIPDTYGTLAAVRIDEITVELVKKETWLQPKGI